MHKQKNLVIGGDGLIGKNLVKQLIDNGELVEQTTRRPENKFRQLNLELCAQNVPDFISEFDVIYNCGAIVGFALCEVHPLGYRVNVDAPMAIARLLVNGQKMIHMSSDAVEFALNTALGLQKALVEIGLLATKRCVIVRLKRVTAANVTTACHQIIQASKLAPPALVIAT